MTDQDPSTPPTDSFELKHLRLPVVFALVAFVASVGMGWGVSYSTFATKDGVEDRVERAIGTHAARPHVGSLTDRDLKGVVEQLGEIKKELERIRTELEAVKTGLAVLKSRGDDLD